MKFLPFGTSIRAFLSRLRKILAFSNSKSYFIRFDNTLYNPLNIKDFIFAFIPLKYYKKLIKIK